MTRTVYVMAFASARDQPLSSRLRRWSSIGIRTRSSSIENSAVCPSVISYTLIRYLDNEINLGGLSIVISFSITVDRPSLPPIAVCFSDEFFCGLYVWLVYL